MKAASDLASCNLSQQIDTAALPVISALPFVPTPKGAWSPIVRPFSLLPIYLVAGSANKTAYAALTLSNNQAISHSVQVVTDCYNETR